MAGSQRAIRTSLAGRDHADPAPTRPSGGGNRPRVPQTAGDDRARRAGRRDGEGRAVGRGQHEPRTRRDPEQRRRRQRVRARIRHLPAWNSQDGALAASEGLGTRIEVGARRDRRSPRHRDLHSRGKRQHVHDHQRVAARSQHADTRFAPLEAHLVTRLLEVRGHCACAQRYGKVSPSPTANTSDPSTAGPTCSGSR